MFSLSTNDEKKRKTKYKNYHFDFVVQITLDSIYIFIFQVVADSKSVRVDK